MGSQPISIQLRKILWEKSWGNCCGKNLQEIVGEIVLAGNSCLREILAGNFCQGNGGGEKANLRKTVIGGNLAFGIG